MSKQLYVGNLSYGVTNQSLEALFSQYGEVQSAKVVTDRETGRSKGFGFVEMVQDNEALSAIESLHGKEVDGRAIVVNEARPQAAGGGGGARRGGGGGGGYGGGGGGGGRRGGGGGGGYGGGGGGGYGGGGGGGGGYGGGGGRY